MSSHFGLEVLEEASFFGSAELINFVDISPVVAKVGLLTVALLNESSSAAHMSVGGRIGLLNNGFSSVVEVALVVDVALVKKVTLLVDVSVVVAH